MKLRSIALAGLLGSVLLMTSGCSKDDVTDAVNNALKTNVIHVANGTGNVLTYSIEGELDSNSQDVNSHESKMFFTEGQDVYTVSNSLNNTPKDFAKDKAHLYAQCAVSGDVLTDTATPSPRQIEIINLSDAEITSGGSVTVTLYDKNDVDIKHDTLNNTLAVCARATLDLDGVALKNVKTVEINDVNYTVPDYDQNVIDALDSLNDVDFDIVVFDAATNKGTIVPLATAAELSKASN